MVGDHDAGKARSTRHPVGVWNPSYAAAAMDVHLEADAPFDRESALTTTREDALRLGWAMQSDVERAFRRLRAPRGSPACYRRGCSRCGSGAPKDEYVGGLMLFARWQLRSKSKPHSRLAALTFGLASLGYPE